MSESTIKVDLDYVLVHELGQFGLFQVLNILLMTVPIMVAASLGDFVFTAADLPHRCRIPECEQTGTAEFAPPWMHDAIPQENSLSSCFRFAPSKVLLSHQEQLQCSPLLFNKSLIVGCENYVYEQDNTIVYDFNIGCNEWIRSLPGTISGIGCLLALPIVGYFSDRFGRRLALIISILFSGLLGVLRAFSINYSMYVTLHLLQTMLGSGVFSTAYIMATELTGPQYRMATGTIAAVFYSLGAILLGCLAYLIPPWRYLTLALYLPCILAVPIYAFVLVESVRWLLSKQKYPEAKNVLQKVAKVNRKQISPETMTALMKLQTKQDDSDPSLILAITSSPVLLRRVCTTPLWWMATTLSFYGLTYNSTSLSDDMHLNFVLVAAVEIPGFLCSFLILDRIGRKPVLIGGFFLCTMFSLSFILVPVDMTGLRIGLTLLAKFGVANVFNCLYLYTSELYPTKHRHLLLGFSSMIGRIGNIVAPLTPALSQYWSGAPQMIFGVTSLIAGVLALTQPETLGTTLPDTLQQAEDLGKTSKAL